MLIQSAGKIHRHLLLLLMCVSVCHAVNAQRSLYQLDWDTCHGANFDDYLKGVVQLADGGFICAGYSEPDTGRIFHQTTGGFTTAVMMRLDSNLAPVWVKGHGGPSLDEINGVIALSNGSFVSYGHASTNGGSVWGKMGANSTNDGWVINFDLNGDTLWTRCIGGVSDNEMIDGVALPNGEFMLMGWHYGVSAQVTRHVGSRDVWLAKMDTSGTVVWERTFGSSGFDQPLGLSVLSDGGIVAVCSTATNDNDFPLGLGSSDWHVIRLDSSGAVVWQKVLGGSSVESLCSIYELNNGELLVYGASQSNDGDIDSNSYKGATDLVLMRLDSNGVLLSSRNYGSSENEYPLDLIQMANGNLVLLSRNYDGDDHDVPRNYGGADIWLLEIDDTGKILSSMTYGGSSLDLPTAVFPHTQNGFQVFGYTKSWDLNVSHPIHTTVPTGYESFDFWMAELSPCNYHTDSFSYQFCEGEVYFHPLVGTGTSFVMDTTIVDSLFTVSGCDSTVFTILEFNDIPDINEFSQDANCGQQNGWISLQVSNVPAPSFSWNTGDTIAYLANLGFGSYSATVTSQSGCSDSTVVAISEAGAPEIVVDSIRKADCLSDSGEIHVSVSGGPQPYAIHWSHGVSDSQTISARAGNYSITVTDISGCRRHVNVLLPEVDSCEADIYGKVFWDRDSNCIFNGTDVGLSGVRVRLSDGQSQFSDANGDYTFKAIAGPYGITQFPMRTYLADSCQANQIIYVTVNSGSDTVRDQNFANHLLGLSELNVSLSCPRTRLNTTQFNAGNIRNLLADSITIDFHVDYASNLYWGESFVIRRIGGDTIWPLVDTIDKTLDFQFLLSVNEIVDFRMKLEVPGIPEVAIGELACNTYSWKSAFANTMLQVDSFDCCKAIVGAYDPNEKTVSPDQVDGRIYAADSLLTYTIYFQNTGTDTAYDVVILDTLDGSFLDVRTFQLGGATHAYTASFLTSNIVEFRFEGIYLPDSGIDNPGSNGHVWFTIETLGGLLPDDEIANSAGIYFDYNPPIITNTVISVFSVKASDSTGTSIDPKLALQISVYPNPNSGEQLFIETGSVELKWYELISLDGRIVQSGILEPLERNGISVRDVGNGVYLLQLSGDEFGHSRMIVIQR